MEEEPFNKYHSIWITNKKLFTFAKAEKLNQITSRIHIQTIGKFISTLDQSGLIYWDMCIHPLNHLGDTIKTNTLNH